MEFNCHDPRLKCESFTLPALPFAFEDFSCYIDLHNAFFVPDWSHNGVFHALNLGGNAQQGSTQHGNRKLSLPDSTHGQLVRPRSQKKKKKKVGKITRL